MIAGACNSDRKARENDSAAADTSMIDTARTDSMGVMDTTNMNMQDSLGNAKNPRP